MKDRFDILNKYLKEKGLKSTQQRDRIAREFFNKHQHLTVEELLEKVRTANPHIGYATVYRTLRLLTECGLAFKREFGGSARFESITNHHHDHLICLGCGRIVEFENNRIEDLQETTCSRYNFQLVRHKMELYGYCERCSKRPGSGKPASGKPVPGKPVPGKPGSGRRHG